MRSEGVVKLSFSFEGSNENTALRWYLKRGFSPFWPPSNYGPVCALRKSNEPLLPEGTIKCTHLNHSKFTDDANKNKQKWWYYQRKNYIGTCYSIMHLKTFEMISNEIPILLLLVCRCIQKNFLIFTFMSKYFFKSLWQREAYVSFLSNNSFWTVHTCFINKPPSFLEVLVLIF